MAEQQARELISHLTYEEKMALNELLKTIIENREEVR